MPSTRKTRSPAKPKIRLIAAAPTAAPARAGDRLGGREHGLVSRVRRALTPEIDAGKFAAKLSRSVSTAVDTVGAELGRSFGELEVDSISIAFAVTAEGDIGIATAGIEASIEVELKRKQR